MEYGSVGNVDDVVSIDYQTLGRGDDQRRPQQQRRRRPEGEAGAAPQGGRAVQVEPMKPVLKAPGAMRLKLRYDGPL